MSQAVAVLHRDSVIERVAKGDRLIDIAKSYGLTTHAAISKQLASDPDYQAARLTGLEARMETREEELEGAGDKVTVARARELLSHARWRAEREAPAIWGQRSHVTVETVGDLGERLRRADDRRKGRTINAEDAQIVASAPLAKPSE